jgi:hypothetical protein
VLQLDSILTKETMEEVRHWDPKPMVVEVSKQHRLPRLWEGHHLTGRSSPSGDLLRRKETLRHEALQLCLHHQ